MPEPLSTNVQVGDPHPELHSEEREAINDLNVRVDELGPEDVGAVGVDSGAYATPAYVDSVASGLMAKTAIVVASADAPDELRAAADYTCDGTDDHVEINAALDAAEPGDEVVLSRGTFNLGGTVWVPFGGALRGQGKAGTRLKLQDGAATNLDTVWWRSSGGDMSVILGNEFDDGDGTGSDPTRESYQGEGVVLEGFTVEGNTDELSGRITGVLLSSVEDVEVRNVHVEEINYHAVANVDPSNGFGLVTRYCRNVTLWRPSGRYCGYECLGIYDGSRDVEVFHPDFGEAGRVSGQIHRGCHNITIHPGKFLNAGSLDGGGVHGFTSHATSSEPSSGIHLRGVVIDVSDATYGERALQVMGDHTESTFDVEAETSIGHCVDITGVQRGRFIGSAICHSADHYAAIFGAGCKDFRITGNFVSDGFGINLGESENCWLDDYTIRSDANFAIRCGSGATDVLIGRGLAESDKATALMVETVSGYVTVSGGTFLSHDTFAVQFLNDLTNREKSVLSNCNVERVGGGSAVQFRHGGGQMLDNRIVGTVRFREVPGVTFLRNTVGAVEFISTTVGDHVLHDNVIGGEFVRDGDSND